MKKILLALFVSLSLASSACGVEAELSPGDAPASEAVEAEAVGAEAQAISGQTCRDEYEACLADPNPSEGQPCRCDNDYRRCMHRPVQLCLPD